MINNGVHEIEPIPERPVRITERASIVAARSRVVARSKQLVSDVLVWTSVAGCTVPVELDVRVEHRLPEQIEIAAYYLVAEALTNAAKHAQASVVAVEIDTSPRDAGNGVLRVRVRDDGRGGADLAGGSGLVGLKDRAEALGGRFWVETAPGAGSSVHAELPLGPAGQSPAE